MLNDPDNQPLDIEQPEALLHYLRTTGRIGPSEQPTLRVLAGGVSNRTVLVERPGGEAWVLKQALAKLRVKVDWFSDPVRIEREAEGLRWLDRLLQQVIPGAITPLVFEDRDHHLLAMQAVPQPHENWKTMLLAGRVEPEHVRQFASLLGTIHREASRRAGEVAAAFDDRSFFETLRLEPYYRYTASQVSQARPFLSHLLHETVRRRHTLVHGDYSPKNILVHHGRLILLDHEVIHWGDPAFDLGFAFTHLLSKAHHLPSHREAFADAARLFWRTYQQALGDLPWRGDLEWHAVCHTLGCMLARVAGRSPLEYLNEQERSRQRDAVVALMDRRPQTMDSLITDFLARL